MENPVFEAPATVDDGMLTASRPGPHDSGLLLLLSLFDRDPRPDELEGFQPGLREQLEAIVLDERVVRLARVRAISALAGIGDDESFDIVVSLSRDDEAHPRLRMAALWAIGHRFEDRAGREAILSEALGEPDHALRLHAVLSLAHIGSEEAMRIIDAHRIAERHVAVRKVLRELREADLDDDARLPPEGLSRPGAGSLDVAPMVTPQAPGSLEENR